MAEMEIRIDKAYCVQADKVLDIFGARDFYLEGSLSKAIPPVKLSFLCSDPDCRNNGVRVTGVNCHCDMNDDQKFKVAHYRKLDPHLETCEWAELEAALQELQKQPPGLDPLNACRRFTNAKAGNIIDIFDPPTSQSHIDNTEAINSSGKSVPTSLVGKAQRLAAKMNLLRTSPNTSGRLILVVRAYIDLGPVDRKSAKVKIPIEGKVTYDRFFRKVKSWNSKIPNRISYAMVDHVEETNGFIRIHFREGVLRPDSSVERGKQTFHPTFIELHTNAIDTQRGKKAFRTDLDMCGKTGCMGFTYGVFEQEGDTYVCRPGILSNVVILPYADTK